MTICFPFSVFVFQFYTFWYALSKKDENIFLLISYFSSIRNDFTLISILVLRFWINEIYILSNNNFPSICDFRFLCFFVLLISSDFYLRIHSFAYRLPFIVNDYDWDELGFDGNRFNLAEPTGCCCLASVFVWNGGLVGSAESCLSKSDPIPASHKNGISISIECISITVIHWIKHSTTHKPAK